MPAKRNKLLIIGSFVNKDAMELQYTRGFLKQDWQVYSYEIQQPLDQLWRRSLLDKMALRFLPNIYLNAINKKVIAHVKELQPDVVLIFKGMQLFPNTVAVLKKHTALLCNYNLDHPLEIYSRGGTNKNVISSVEHFDVFFTYSNSIVKKIISQYNISSYCIPFGFDPLLNEKYGSLPLEQIDSYLFYGTWDKARERFLNALGRDDVAVYGDVEWGTRTKRNGLAYKNFKRKKLYDAELYTTIRSSIGVINNLREQNIVENSHNMRTFEVPGYGGLLISQFTEEQAYFFEPNKEAIYFSSIEELNDKLEYLKRAPKEVNKIKINALNRSMKCGYSYNDRAKQMSDFIRKHLQ
ncbi:MAG: glycosyltransferase [Flavisolibacter sp.]|nr:glycosyltransferase [Flavisolibacter sp.]